jgi:hypothetical protein
MGVVVKGDDMKRVKFKEYAGVRKNGTVWVEPTNTGKHIDNAAWLTAQVESGGKFGCVINYDGTAMTASIGQAIAVYPRALADDIVGNDQGPLWKVLRRINSLPGLIVPLEKIKAALANKDWFISEDNKCRWMGTGNLVSGNTLRKEFSGSVHGIMPFSGPNRERAEHWVELFHELFTHPDTFKVQMALEKEHFVKRCERVRLRFCSSQSDRIKTLQDAIYGTKHISVITSKEMGPAMDLAMCMFWSHSVNAPSFALKKFCKQVVDKDMAQGIPIGVHLAATIIRKLGDTPFGRWDDDIPNGRYQRTRRYAMKVWPNSLFHGADAVMPIDL